MPPKTLQIRNSTAEFLIFTKQAGENGIEVRVQDGTIWLSQKLMAALFDCTVENVIIHLKNIFAEGELNEISVTKDFLVTASDGKNYKTKHYNLDAIIAVGCRIYRIVYLNLILTGKSGGLQKRTANNNERAVQFRKWANQIVKDYCRL